MNFRTKIAAACGMLVASQFAYATPSLQLDIVSDSTYYDTGDASVMTSSSNFDIYAYGNTAYGNGDPADFTKEHYLSIAVISPTGVDATTDFGSFSINGTSYDFTSMVYGNPPMEDQLFSGITFDANDLQKHGIYPTLFTEVSFYFDPNQTRSDVNVQDTPGTDPTANPGDAIAYMGFNIDISGLLDGYELHFDLFNVDLKTAKRTGDVTDVDTGDFAPFSHDAGTTSVPAPATVFLMGAGLLGLGLTRIRSKRA